jgi:hypothetical protein
VRPRRARRGAIAPLAAVLLVLMLGLVAFAVDIGWIVVTRTQLQAAADAAALAGADPLMEGYVQYQLAGLTSQSAAARAVILSTSMSNARARAKQFAALNAAGGVPSLVLNDSDIEFGYTDPSGNYTPYSSGQPFPNTIKVLLRRDASANGPLNLFFAPVLGARSANVLATAAAVLMGGPLDNFQNLGRNIGVLPATYDVNAWNNFLKTGQAPDGSISLSSYNTLPQLQVYPSIKDPGNFGQISLNDSHVGASTERGWVDNGLSPSDLAALQNAGLLPLSQHNPNLWDWQGDTGFKASLVMDINQYSIDRYPNKTFIIPLFKPYSPEPNYQAGVGQGANYFYNVVGFAGIKIMPGGGNRQVLVQPAAVVPAGGIFASLGIVDTSQSSSTFTTTFSYPRLSL